MKNGVAVCEVPPPPAPPPAPAPPPPPPDAPASAFNGKSFTLATPSRGGWTDTFTVTGQADGFTLMLRSQFNASCKITGPGSRCSWTFEGRLGGQAQAAAEAIHAAGGFNEQNSACGNNSIGYMQEVIMASDGSLNIYSYYEPNALACRQTGSSYYWRAYLGTLPVSYFPQIVNGSRVTYGINWELGYL